VHIATPTTLVTMLRTAQYAWQQEALSENARAVFDLGRELYDRLAQMGKHMDHLGRALTNSVSTYNKTVGSLEGRVLVSARRLNQLGVVESELEPPQMVEETIRALSAPELVADSGSDRPELVAAALSWPAVEAQEADSTPQQRAAST
jgi:DNA recombination protein RmuC